VFWDLLFGALLAWMILGGVFQVVTGCDAGIASFRSRSTPSTRVVRISGIVALLVGLLLVPVLVGVISGAIPGK
jgi:uncharacterized membrane protein HdeD (DUF308 family)